MSDDFIEGRNREVVIKDFSAKGVEAFLRFFYTGTLNISQVDVIVEVQVLADKYQVPELHSLCKEIIKNEMKKCDDTTECLDSFPECR